MSAIVICYSSPVGDMGVRFSSSRVQLASVSRFSGQAFVHLNATIGAKAPDTLILVDKKDLAAPKDLFLLRTTNYCMFHMTTPVLQGVH